MARKPKTDRKTVEVGRKLIPLRSIMHGKEIREAAKAIEDFRLNFKEEEILYGAKLYINWQDYGNVYIVARRLETDAEYEDRLERARIAAEQKLERERKRKEREEIMAREKEIRKRKEALEFIRKLAKDQGISEQELVDSLKSMP